MDIDGKTVDLKPIPKLKVMKRISARKSCLIAPIGTCKNQGLRAIHPLD